MCPGKDSRAGKGLKSQSYEGQLREMGVFGYKPGEKEARGRPYCSLQCPERRLFPGGGGQSLLPGN